MLALESTICVVCRCCCCTCCSAIDYSAAEALVGFKTKLLQRKGLPADTQLLVVPVSLTEPKQSCLTL
jgi:hypothetical protein